MFLVGSQHFVTDAKHDFDSRAVCIIVKKVYSTVVHTVRPESRYQVHRYGHRGGYWYLPTAGSIMRI
jgi:hypothetical protein